MGCARPTVGGVSASDAVRGRTLGTVGRLSSEADGTTFGGALGVGVCLHSDADGATFGGALTAGVCLRSDSDGATFGDTVVSTRGRFGAGCMVCLGAGAAELCGGAGAGSCGTGSGPSTALGRAILAGFVNVCGVTSMQHWSVRASVIRRRHTGS